MFKNFRVYLRALEPDDYKNSIKWRKDDEIWDMLVGPKHFVSEAYERQWVEDSIFNKTNKLSLAVCIKETNEHIGYAYLTDINWKNRSATTGKLIGVKEHWGKGYATEITNLILYHAFYILGLHRIESRQLVSNIGSVRSLEKCGYVKEGVLREAVFKNGKFRDLNIMSILREDYDNFIKDYKDELDID